MAGAPFKLKEITKEKEATLAEKIPLKDKHEKEKSEADKPHKDTKDSKDQKDQKEQKDKQEKEKHEKEKQEKDGKNESKDQTDKHKHEKEIKDRKDVSPKEIKDGALEKLPEAKTGESEAGAAQVGAEAAAAAAGPQKTVDKVIEKVHKDKVEKPEKEKFEKLEKHEKVEIKEFEKVIYDVKYLEVPPGGPVGPGPVESRLAALEAAVAQLVHFIPENLRPDLSKGALRQEPDAQAEQKPEAPSGGSGATAGEPAAEPPKKEGEKKK